MISFYISSMLEGPVINSATSPPGILRARLIGSMHSASKRYSIAMFRHVLETREVDNFVMVE